jgi:hypothetical protein
MMPRFGAKRIFCCGFAPMGADPEPPVRFGRAQFFAVLIGVDPRRSAAKSLGWWAGRNG